MYAISEVMDSWQEAFSATNEMCGFGSSTVFFILQRKPANLADSYFILAARMMMCVCDYMRLLAEITKSLAFHRNYSICFVAQHMRHSTATNTQNRTKDLSGDRIRT